MSYIDLTKPIDASFELNTKGESVCKRGGAACDIFSKKTTAKELALWIMHHCDFDKIYFYGDRRPLHVSISEDMSGTIYLMKKIDGNKKIPIQCNKDNFLSKLKNRFIYCVILFVFLLYPATTDAILKIYKCEKIDDIWYLSADLSIECFNNKWDGYAVGGAFLMIIYVFGIPYFFYWILNSFVTSQGQLYTH